MKPGTTIFASLFAAALALVVLAPSAAAEAEPPNVLCPPQPLGTGGGVVGDVKALGNTVIYGTCVFVFDVAGSTIVLIVDGVNLVCVFVTGSPCTTLLLNVLNIPG